MSYFWRLKLGFPADEFYGVVDNLLWEVLYPELIFLLIIEIQKIFTFH